MKKLLLLLLSSLTLFAKLQIIVSILPEKTFVKKIAKEKVDITVMVSPGNSPHSYEPKASQMIALSKADIYFSIGVEFENVWLEKFKSQNQNLHFINLAKGIKKIAIAKHHHEEHNADTENTEHTGLDPHIWTSPKNVAIMAHTICRELTVLDPANKPFFEENLRLFLKEVESTDRRIKDILHNTAPESRFMVFHPSWGYFANEYKLTQLAIEVGGKNPKPKEMIQIIKEAKEEQVKVIFTQPEFSDKSARIIAKETGVKVLKFSPLNPDWSNNLINMAKAIADEK